MVLVSRGRRQVLLAAGALLLPSGLPRAQDNRGPINVTLTGLGVAGAYRVMVETISTILRDSYAGSAITFKPSTPAGGLQMVAEEKADISFAALTPELDAALKGTFPFTRPLAGKFGWLALIHDKQVFYFIADRKWSDQHGIRTLDDIATRKPPVRVANNRKGNLQSVVIVEDVFRSHGFSSLDIDRWGGATSWVPGPEGLDLLADGKVDLFANANFVQWANLSKLSGVRELVWLDLTVPKLKRVTDKWGFQIGAIPKGSYNFITEDKPTVKQWTNAVVGLHVPDATVTKVLQALRDNVHKMQGIHPAFAEFSLAGMARKPTDLIPYHPAAERFYRVSGVLS